MVDDDTTGPSIQPVGARFVNFLLRKLSQEFKLHESSILHEWPYCLRIASRLGIVSN